MSALIPHCSCSSSLIPTANGDVLVKGEPNNVRVTFPVTNQFWIKKQCETPEASQVSFPGGCENFLRNNNYFKFINAESAAFGPEHTNSLIQKIGTCHSDGLPAYLKWKAKNSPEEQPQITNISRVCNIQY